MESIFRIKKNPSSKDTDTTTTTMTAHFNCLQQIPSFPNYTAPTFGYPERTITYGTTDQSLIILGPPINLYQFRPPTSCTVHVSGIPSFASMQHVVNIFEDYGKIYTIELSVTYSYTGKTWNNSYRCNGYALVTFVTYEATQKALFAHMTRRIPGLPLPLSIYKGSVSNVVLLKNLPFKTPKSTILSHIHEYPGVLSIQFTKANVARMVFADLDYALLFMDVVSGGGLVIDGFTCTVDTEEKYDDDDDHESD